MPPSSRAPQADAVYGVEFASPFAVLPYANIITLQTLPAMHLIANTGEAAAARTLQLHALRAGSPRGCTPPSPRP